MKIGIVTFGGGYAMIPLIESEVVDKHHWMTKEEFLDAIATTQVCPGALGHQHEFPCSDISWQRHREPSSAPSALRCHPSLLSWR